MVAEIAESRQAAISLCTPGFGRREKKETMGGKMTGQRRNTREIITDHLLTYLLTYLLTTYYLLTRSGDQEKPGEPGHRNIGRGSCRSALADGQIKD